MENNIEAKWHAELTNNTKLQLFKAQVFDEGEHLLLDIKAESASEVINEMRDKLSKLIEGRFGKGCGQSLRPSTTVGDYTYLIPIDVVNMRKGSVGGAKPLDDYPEKEKDTNETPKNEQGTNVEFTDVLPNREGFYFYSQDKTNQMLTIVKVTEVKEPDAEDVVLYVEELGDLGSPLIEDFASKDAIWSKRPIDLPVIEEQPEKKAVDHTNW